MADKALEKIYTASFFGRRNQMSWRVPVMCDAIIDVFKPRSVIDIGCGIGDLIQGFRERGLFAHGIEGSKEVIPFLACPTTAVTIFDLKEPFPAAMIFDLAMSLEVAEHIEPEYAENFVETLSNFSNRVLLSIAPPGQGGHHHVNCQPIEYWDVLFFEHQLARNDRIAQEVKKPWEAYANKRAMRAYFHNLHYYEREDCNGGAVK